MTEDVNLVADVSDSDVALPSLCAACWVAACRRVSGTMERRQVEGKKRGHETKHVPASICKAATLNA